MARISFVRPGSALIMAIIFLGAIAVITFFTLDRGQQNIRTTSRRVNDQEAVRIAESGVEKAVYCLNNLSNKTDCPTNNNMNQNGTLTGTLGQGSYATTITSAGNTATIDSASTVQGSGGTTTRHIQTVLTTTNTFASFNYGVLVGLGGVSMSNSTAINGGLYANGTVTGVNSATINGDVVIATPSGAIDSQADPAAVYQTQVFGSSANNAAVVQSFVPATSKKVYEIDIKIARNGSVTTNPTLDIYSDNGNKPNVSLGSVSIPYTMLPINTPGTWESAWTEINFTPQTSVTAGTKYWIVLKDSATNATKNFQVVTADNIDTLYSNGTGKIGTVTFTTLNPACNGGTTACDIAFTTKMGGTFPTLEMPTVTGDARVNTISNTTIGKDAYYQNLLGTVKANGGAETCTMNPPAGSHCHVVTSDPSFQPFPFTTAQIAQMEAQAGTTVIGTQSFNSGTRDLGPVIINGDLNLSNSAIVKLTGTIWIKGNLNMANTTQIVLDNAYGSSSGVIILDDPANPTTKGKASFSNSANVLGNSTAGTYIMLIAMSNDTSSSVISVSNSLTAGILYVPNGLVTISNSPHVKELSANKIIMSNTATIDYDSGLASIYFSSGPGASWVYKKGSYQIVD